MVEGPNNTRFCIFLKLSGNSLLKFILGSASTDEGSPLASTHRMWLAFIAATTRLKKLILVYNENIKVTFSQANCCSSTVLSYLVLTSVGLLRILAYNCVAFVSFCSFRITLKYSYISTSFRIIICSPLEIIILSHSTSMQSKQYL